MRERPPLPAAYYAPAGDAARPADPAALAYWWRQFDDPLLAELVETALVRSLDQQAALAQARPGVAYEAGHIAAVEALTEGLLRLGLLKGKLEARIADGSYKRYYRHKTGHWIGLDVHDVGDYRIEGESRLLEPGMVFTIEPGLYVAADDTSVDAKWRGIGIRTEDDVLVTKTGHEVLTAGLARTADEIEAFMADAR